MTWNIHHGDCVEVMKGMEDNSVDAVVCDPPYGLAFMGKEWDKYTPRDFQEWTMLWGKEAYRVLKHGGHLLAFGGSRTYHRMASGIEDAGFEIRDQIMWVYGSGFPKSLNIGKAVDKLRMAKFFKDNPEIHKQYKWLEKELSDVEKLIKSEEDRLIRENLVDDPQEEIEKDTTPELLKLHNQKDETEYKMKEIRKKSGNEREETGIVTSVTGNRTKLNTHQNTGKLAVGIGKQEALLTKGTSEWEGWGTALKPAHEPICMARKPLSEKTVAENVLKWGTGGINIDESRVGGEATPINKLKNWSGFGQEIKPEYEATINTSGRFPANLIHDGSDEVRECFPETNGGKAKHNSDVKRVGMRNDGSSFNSETCGFDVNKYQGMANFGDSGSASRFFYCAKASKREKNTGLEGLEDSIGGGMAGTQDQTLLTGSGNIKNNIMKNNHPTVKPIALMEYLIKMITPKGGIVLDPFMGSGSTGVAAKKNGFEFIGIEMEEEYIPIATARLEHAEEWGEKFDDDLPEQDERQQGLF